MYVLLLQTKFQTDHRTLRGQSSYIKALFFVNFHPSSKISSQDFIQSKNDCIKLESLIQ